MEIIIICTSVIIITSIHYFTKYKLESENNDYLFEIRRRIDDFYNYMCDIERDNEILETKLNEIISLLNK